VEEKVEYLRHYTGFSNLIKILDSGKLLLSNPEKWEDKNDFASVNAYKRLTGEKEIRVLCFAHGPELVHHWFYFADKDGCCIFFKNKKILDEIQKSKYLHGTMKYYAKEDLPAAKLNTFKMEAIPFIKRRPFECEKEYRVIWTGKSAGSKSVPAIPIKDCIDYVTLGPRFSESVREHVSKGLKEKYRIKTKQSRILELKDWIRMFNKLK